MPACLARGVRALLVALVVAGVVVLTPGTSWACSCVGGSAAQQAKRADTVVDATLDWSSTNGIETTYGVTVAHVYKGRAGEQEKLVGPASAAACGLGSLATRKRYLFFITGEHPGSMKVSSCGGSAPYAAATAAQVQAVTGAPTGPVAVPPSANRPVDPAPIDGTHWYTIVLTGLAVAGALGAILLLARRSRG